MFKDQMRRGLSEPVTTLHAPLKYKTSNCPTPYTKAQTSPGLTSLRNQTSNSKLQGTRLNHKRKIPSIFIVQKNRGTGGLGCSTLSPDHLNFPSQLSSISVNYQIQRSNTNAVCRPAQVSRPCTNEGQDPQTLPGSAK